MYVSTTDLNLLVSAWLIKEPPKGSGILSIPNGICADFGHNQEGGRSGWMRVSTADLNILVGNWLVKEPPKGSGIPGDCPGIVIPLP
jgi:hypothetical protein